MAEICKNCSGEIDLNFCSNCGQKKSKRIDAKYLKDEFQYVLVHTNKGFFHSIKKIIKAPGKTALEFIDGNRVNHYKPIALVFVLAGISAFLVNTFVHPIEIYKEYNKLHNIENKAAMIKMFEVMTKYKSLFMLLSIPLVALTSWLAFKKWGFNYFENIVAMAYFMCSILIFDLLVIFPMQLLITTNFDLFMSLIPIVQNLYMIVLCFWFFFQFYPKKDEGDVVLRVLRMFFYFIVLTIILSVIAGLIYFSFK